MVRNLIKKLFYRDEWIIGYRKIAQDSALPVNAGNSSYYLQMKGRPVEWYADPFPFVKEGKTYLFFEIMNLWRGKGSLGCCELTSDGYGKIKEIIREPFHMSFPNVFEIDGSIYMIPETSEKEEIRLYNSVKFPYEWKYEKTLAKGLDAVDTTVRIEDDKVILITYLDKEKQTIVFKCDKNFNEVEQEKIVDFIENYRPAGNSFNSSGLQLRPLQDCEKIYGGRVFLYKETGSITDGSYSSAYYGTVEPEYIRNSTESEAHAVHTFCRTEDLEIIDYACCRKHFLKLIYKMRDKLRH